MSQQGATLQTYNNELVKCELFQKAHTGLQGTPTLQALKTCVLNGTNCTSRYYYISILTERLARINESLARKIQMRNDFDKTIAETESAYNKVRNQHINIGITIISCRFWRVHRLYFMCLNERVAT